VGAIKLFVIIVKLGMARPGDEGEGFLLRHCGMACMYLYNSQISNGG